MKAWPDWDEFVRRLREDSVFREEVRRQVLTEDLLNLPAVVSRVLDLQRQTLEAVRGMAAAVEAFVGEVRTAFGRVEAQIADLTEQVGENGRQIATLTEALREGFGKLREQLAVLTNRVFEREVRGLARVIFRGGRNLGPALRRAAGEALRMGVIPPDDWMRLDLLDLLWGRGETVFVGEVSETVGAVDIVRAMRAVDVLRRLGWGRGLRLLPVVVGREVGRVPEAVGWVRFDPDEEVLEISPGIEVILREEEPKPVGPERFFGDAGRPVSA